MRSLDLDDDPAPQLDATGGIPGLSEDPSADASASDWACTDGVNLIDGSLIAPAEPLSLSVDVVDAERNGVVPGLTFTQCGRLQAYCELPEPLAPRPGEAPPRYRFEVPFQWWDTLQLAAPGYIDTRYYIDGVVRTDRSGEIIEMFQTTMLERVLSALGEAPDPERGLVFVHIIDCNGKRVAGAGLESVQGRSVDSFRVVDGEAVGGAARSDDDGVIGFSALSGPLAVQALVQCSNGELPRHPEPASSRLRAYGAPPPASTPPGDAPVCDGNDEALIGAAVVTVTNHAITIAELRPGL